MTVFVYVNTGKQVGDPDHIKVFANVDAARTKSMTRTTTSAVCRKPDDRSRLPQ